MADDKEKRGGKKGERKAGRRTAWNEPRKGHSSNVLQDRGGGGREGGKEERKAIFFQLKRGTAEDT